MLCGLCEPKYAYREAQHRKDHCPACNESLEKEELISHRIIQLPISGFMSILTDPEIQVTTYWTIERFTLLATWFTAFGTIAAAFTAVWLGYRTGRVKLDASVDIAMIYDPDRGPDEGLSIRVTNRGERPVTITSVDWRIGKMGNRKITADQTILKQCPRKLEHGEPTSFFISFFYQPSWLKRFATDVVRVAGRSHIKTLRVRIHTSVGRTTNVVPAEGFLKVVEKEVEEAAQGNSSS